MKKYGLPSPDVVTTPTRKTMAEALSRSGDHGIRLMKQAGYEFVDGKFVEIPKRKGNGV